MSEFQNWETTEEKIQYLCDRINEMNKCMDKEKAEALLKSVGMIDENGHLTTNYHTQAQADEYNKRFVN